MSFENDITEIYKLAKAGEPLLEGFAEARRRYVETLDPATQQPLMPLAMLKRLAAKDPTYPAKGKYVEWIAKQYMNSHSMRGLDAVKEFDKILTTKPTYLEKKDINQYTTVDDLHNAVDAVRARVSAEREQKKDRIVRGLLAKAGGSEDKAFKWAAGQGAVRNAAHDAGEQISDEEAARRAAELGRGSLVNEYGITLEYVKKIKKKMQAEGAGAAWRDFSIDTDIFNEIAREPYSIETKDSDGKVTTVPLPADLVFENDKVAIVCPPNEEKSRLYGRDPDYDPNDPHQTGSPWCTSYATRSTQWGNYYGRQGDTFYIIMPKSIDIVPEKRFKKINVQVKAKRHGETDDSPVRLTTWDCNDTPIPRPEYRKIFKAWGIPLQKTVDDND